MVKSLVLPPLLSKLIHVRRKRVGNVGKEFNTKFVKLSHFKARQNLMHEDLGDYRSIVNPSDVTNLQIKLNQTLRSLEDSQINERKLARKLTETEDLLRRSEYERRSTLRTSPTKQSEIEALRFRLQAEIDSLKAQLNQKNDEIATLRQETSSKDPEIIRFVHATSKLIRKILEKGSSPDQRDLNQKLQTILIELTEFLPKSSSTSQFFSTIHNLIEVIVDANCSLTDVLASGDQSYEVRKLQNENRYLQSQLQDALLERDKKVNSETKLARDIAQLQADTESAKNAEILLRNQIREERTSILNLSIKLNPSRSPTSPRIVDAPAFLQDELKRIESSFEKVQKLRDENEAAKSALLDFTARHLKQNISPTASLVAIARGTMEGTAQLLKIMNGQITKVASLFNTTNDKIIDAAENFVKKANTQLDDSGKVNERLANLQKDLQYQIAQLQQQLMDSDDNQRRLKEELERAQFETNLLRESKSASDSAAAIAINDMKNLESQYQSQLRALQTSMSRTMNEVDRYKARNNEMQTQLESKGVESSQNEKKIRELRTQIEHIEEVNSEQKSQIEKLLDNKSKTENDLESLKAQLQMAREDNELLQKLRPKISQLESENNDLRTQNEMNSENIQNINEQYQAAVEAFETIKQRYRKIRQQAKALAGECERLKAANDDQMIENGHQNDRFDELTKSFQEAQIQTKKLSEENNRLRSDLNARHKELTKLNSTYKQAISEIDILRQHITRIDSENQRMNSELIKYSGIEAALEEAENQKENYAARIEQMNAELTELRQTDVDHQFALDDINKLHSANQELREQNMQMQNMIVGLQNDLNTATNNIDQLQTANDQLNKENASLRISIDQRKEHLKEARMAKKSLQAMKNTLDAAAKRYETAEADYSSVVEEYRKFKENHDEEISQYQAAVEKLSKQLSKAKKKLENQSQNFNNVNIPSSGTYGNDEERKRLQKDIMRLEQTLDSVRTSSRNDIAQLQDTIASKDTEINDLREQLNERRLRKDQNQMIYDDVQNQVEDIRREAQNRIEEARRQIQSKADEASHLQRMISDTHRSLVLSRPYNAAGVLKCIAPLFDALGLQTPEMRSPMLSMRSFIISSERPRATEAGGRGANIAIANIMDILRELPVDLPVGPRSSATSLEEKLADISRIISCLKTVFEDHNREIARLNSTITSQHNAIVKMSEIPRSPMASPARPRVDRPIRFGTINV